MIQPQTYLTIADNTGAKTVMCIRILGNNRKYANVGDVIIGVVKDALPNMAVKRSSIVRAVIVRTRNTIRRVDGMSIRFDDNAAVIINIENNPKGTRVFGPVAREIRISPRLKTVKNPKDGESKKVELQIPIHISNVMLWDKEENIAGRIGYKMIDNQKRRYFKKSGNLL
eukprot:gene56-60_t